MKFIKVLLPIFRVYQIFGFAPFPIPFDAEKGISRKDQRKWLIYNGILIIYLTVMVSYNIFAYQEFLCENKTEPMLSYLSFLIVTTVRGLAIVITIESIVNSKEQVKFWQRLNSIDRIFRDEIGVEQDYEKLRRTAFIWLAVWFVQITSVMAIVLVDIFGDDSESFWSKLMVILYALPLPVTAMRYYQIIQCIAYLSHRFQMINKRLETIYSGTNRLSTGEKQLKKKITNSTENKTYDEIVTLRRIYHILWENTAELNNTFKWSLLLMIGTSFVIIVVNFYRTLVWLITPTETDIEGIILYFVWSSGHTFFFIRLASTCYNTLQEVRCDFLMNMVK